MRFYESILGFQQRVAVEARTEVRADRGLREQIEVGSLLADFSVLLTLVADKGPSLLSEHAPRLQLSGREEWSTILKQVLDGDHSHLSASDVFLARACLQPVADRFQSLIPAKAGDYHNRCPACDGLPQLSVLRPEGEGASRSLLCSFCLREWMFRRIMCPWCGEENRDKLPRYSAPECGHVVVEACDTCRRYLKAVDMTLDGRAEPLVDEAAVAVLDLWATEYGFEKVVPNLLAF